MGGKLCLLVCIKYLGRVISLNRLIASLSAAMQKSVSITLDTRQLNTFCRDDIISEIERNRS